MNTAQLLIDAMEALLDWRVAVTDALADLDMNATFDDVALMVAEGQLAIHPFDRSLMLCKIDEHDDGRRCYHLWLAVGDMQEMLSDDTYDEITGYAKQHDCTHLSLYNRLGWARVLQGRGWSKPAVYLTKEI